MSAAARIYLVDRRIWPRPNKNNGLRPHLGEVNLSHALGIKVRHIFVGCLFKLLFSNCIIVLPRTNVRKVVHNHSNEEVQHHIVGQHQNCREENGCKTTAAVWLEKNLFKSEQKRDKSLVHDINISFLISRLYLHFKVPFQKTKRLRFVILCWYYTPCPSHQRYLAYNLAAECCSRPTG